ncbi:c-type cytochrome [Shimia aestuarii]|uniref:c-type cytochrome n=1 Tax=Shimia aestuarii TaxID=254406 RepID=UPI001FB54411|nr:cytochrome c [Shimia aestuarii]
MKTALTILATGGAVAVLLACTAYEMPENREGRAIYDAHCAMCHGADGRGQGDVAAGMVPAPADLTTLARGNGGAFPVNRVLSQVDGYLKGEGGDDMPEFGELLEGDLVPVETDDGTLTPTPRPLAALLAYLETVQR